MACAVCSIYRNATQHIVHKDKRSGGQLPYTRTLRWVPSEKYRGKSAHRHIQHCGRSCNDGGCQWERPDELRHYWQLLVKRRSSNGPKQRHKDHRHPNIDLSFEVALHPAAPPRPGSACIAGIVAPGNSCSGLRRSTVLTPVRRSLTICVRFDPSEELGLGAARNLSGGRRWLLQDCQLHDRHCHSGSSTLERTVYATLQAALRRNWSNRALWGARRQRLSQEFFK
jgi:hypothetical protein